MLSYETYKVMHLMSLMVLFTTLSLQLYGVSHKLHKMLTGVATLLVLVSGMGLMARLGISHGSTWPTWIYVKYAVWILVGVGGALVVKRLPRYRRPTYWISLALFFVAATAAVEKF
jgi:uncharacterized membrane protein SirB2